MKLIYLLLTGFVLLSGCTTKTEDSRLQEIRKSADSLRKKQENLGKMIDSLNNESKNEDLKLKQMQIELDSLNKRIENQKKRLN